MDNRKKNTSKTEGPRNEGKVVVGPPFVIRLVPDG